MKYIVVATAEWLSILGGPGSIPKSYTTPLLLARAASVLKSRKPVFLEVK